MKVFTNDGIKYDSVFIKVLIDDTIILRDEALKQNEFHYSIMLSHVICLLNKVLTEIEE